MFSFLVKFRVMSSPELTTAWLWTVWSARVFYLVAFAFTVYILVKHYKKSKQVLKSRVEAGKNANNQSLITLDNLALITFACIAGHSLLLEATQWSHSCKIGNPLAIAAQAIAYIFFIFYQLARLYFTFSTSKDFNIPKWIFITIIIIGTIICLWEIVFPWIHTIVEFENPPTPYYPFNGGCLWIVNSQKLLKFGLGYTLFIILVLDCVVLTLYLKQLYHLKQGFGNNTLDFVEKEIVRKQIQEILNKMIFLSVLYQICAISMYIIRTKVDFSTKWEEGQTLNLALINFLNALERIIITYVIYLMIECNDDRYKAFVRFFGYKLGCMYVCISKDSSSSKDSISTKNAEDTKTGNTTTSDLYILPKNTPQQNKYPNNTESHLNKAMFSQNTTIEGDNDDTPTPDTANDILMTIDDETEFTASIASE